MVSFCLELSLLTSISLDDGATWWTSPVAVAGVADTVIACRAIKSGECDVGRPIVLVNALSEGCERGRNAEEDACNALALSPSYLVMRHQRVASVSLPASPFQRACFGSCTSQRLKFMDQRYRR